MLSRSAAVALLIFLVAPPVHADKSATARQVQAQVEAGPLLAERVAALSVIMQIDDVIGVMRAEGLKYGDTLEAELFPGKGGAGWARVVAQIYDAPLMRQRFDAAFAEALAGNPGELAQIEAFFVSARGQRILALEIEARRALMDEATEDAARASTDALAARNDPRLLAIRRFAAINDLVELNVAGAMNANLAFYRGMVEGGAFAGSMTEDEMLADVWSQEPGIRDETEDWLYPFLSLAYRPLSDSDLDDYIAFSQSPAGIRINVAVFAAFDQVFGVISRDLGRAAAKQMQGQDI